MKTEDDIQHEKELNEKELQEKKLQEEIQAKDLQERMQEKEVQEKELKEFWDKPMVRIEVTPDEKEQIILRFRLTMKISAFFSLGLHLLDATNF